MRRRRGQLPKTVAVALDSSSSASDADAARDESLDGNEWESASDSGSRSGSDAASGSDGADSSDAGAAAPTPKKRHVRRQASVPAPVVLEVQDPDRELKLDGRAIADSDEPSDVKAKRFFEWFIAPMSSDEFFARYFEKRPLVIKRHRPNYYKDWYSTEDIRKVLREHDCKTGRDLDITNYVDGERQTFQLDGRATLETVMRKHEREGCSIRMLCPQEHCDRVSEMLSLLEEHWGLGAGANSYLTPAGAQGFAPHYDDVDVFIVQCEGAKHWRLHPHLQPSDELARTSSRNFSQAEVGAPFAEVDLEAGDLMYFPRGVVHQATSPPDRPSLHLTVSTAYRACWADFLQTALPHALAAAAEADVALRRVFPPAAYDYMGVMHSDADGDARRAAFARTVGEMVERVMRHFPTDEAVDHFAAAFLHARQPLHPAPALRRRLHPAGGPLTARSKIQLVSRRAAVLTVEDDSAVLYHHVRNGRVFHAAPEPARLEFELDFAEALEHVLRAYPRPVRVSALPLPSAADRLLLARTLYEHGLVALVP